jgi:pimeloyl-ACP methyl ester carboxylesterase
MVDLQRTDLEASDRTRIRQWERRPSGAAAAVLFVHGATYGGRSAFDVPGYSWLEQVADAGRAAYAVDVRGYGGSERPAALDEPAEDNEPVVRASTAAVDAATALEHVAEAHETVHLVGYSWGTMTSGLLLTEHGVDVASLVHYAPVYRPPASRRERFSPGDPPTAYRSVTKAEARERWADQRPDGAVPDDAFAAFWEALVDGGQRVGPAEVLAPNGTLVDLEAAIDEPLYEAGAIDVPTLIVRGSLDTASTRDDALGLYDALGVEDRTYTELAGGSHFLQLESRREALFDAVRDFHDRVERA